MSDEKVIDSKDAKLDICNAILCQISNLKISILTNSLNDFVHAFSVLDKTCYNNSLYFSSDMNDFLYRIEKSIFSNDLLGVACNISKLENTVNDVIKNTKDSVNKN